MLSLLGRDAVTKVREGVGQACISGRVRAPLETLRSQLS